MFTRRNLLFPLVGALFGLLIGGLLSYQAYLLNPQGFSDAAGTGDGILAIIAKREWETGQYMSALNTLEGIEEPYQLFPTLESILFIQGPPENHVGMNSFGQEVTLLKQGKMQNVNLPEDVKKAVDVFLVRLLEHCSVENLTKKPMSWDYRSRADAYLQLEQLFRVVVKDEKKAKEILALAKEYATKSTEIGYIEAEANVMEQDAWSSHWVFPLAIASLCCILGCLVKPTLEAIGNQIRDGIVSSTKVNSDAEDSASPTAESIESADNSQPRAIESSMKPR